MVLTKEQLKLRDCSRNPLYAVWLCMRARCCNPKSVGYKKYGEKGITICEEWKNDYISFYNWALNNGYYHDNEQERKDRLSIDRINPNKGYFPNNCRFIPLSQNSSRGKHKGVPRPTLRGRKRSEKTRRLIGIGNTKGFFEMYSLNGTFIRKFENREEIRKFFNRDKLDIGSIRYSAFGLRGRETAYGYKWRYVYN